MISCGVDPSRDQFAVSFISKLKEFKYEVYENSLRGFVEFKKELNKLDEKPLICIEGYGDFAKNLTLYLKEHLYKVYEINPKKSSRLRESMSIHKTDHIDSFTCGLFPFIRDDLEELFTDAKMEGLKNLTRQYRKISRGTTSMKNQMHASLNQAFGPIYKEFFGVLNETSLTFFSNFGSFKEIDDSSPEDIHRGMITEKCCKFKGEYGFQKAVKIKAIVSKLNYIDLDDFTVLQSEVVKEYASILYKMIVHKKNLKKKIDGLVEKLFPEYNKFFSDIKGMTDLQFGCLISEIKDISRFSSDAKLACYSGQGMAVSQSGKGKRDVKNRNYNRNIAHTIHLLALNNVRTNGKFHELYKQRKQVYSKKLRALKSIKRKVVRIVFHRLVAYKKYLQKNYIEKEKQDKKMVA